MESTRQVEVTEPFELKITDEELQSSVDLGVSLSSTRTECHHTSLFRQFVRKIEKHGLARKFLLREHDELLLVNNTMLAGDTPDAVLETFKSIKVGDIITLVFRRFKSGVEYFLRTVVEIERLKSHGHETVAKYHAEQEDEPIKLSAAAIPSTDYGKLMIAEQKTVWISNKEYPNFYIKFADSGEFKVEDDLPMTKDDSFTFKVDTYVCVSALTKGQGRFIAVIFSTTNNNTHCIGLNGESITPIPTGLDRYGHPADIKFSSSFFLESGGHPLYRFRCSLPTESTPRYLAISGSFPHNLHLALNEVQGRDPTDDTTFKLYDKSTSI